jgi:hypothetical protein
MPLPDAAALVAHAAFSLFGFVAARPPLPSPLLIYLHRRVGWIRVAPSTAPPRRRRRAIGMQTSNNMEEEDSA